MSKSMNRTTFIASLIVVLILLTACGGGGNTPPGANPNTASNAGNAASNDPLATTKKQPESATNAAPTVAPIIKVYCDAWVRNDEASLRKVFSSDTLKYFESEMRADKEKSLL